MKFTITKVLVYGVAIACTALIAVAGYCIHYYYNPQQLVDDQIEGYETCANVELEKAKEKEADECRQYLKRKNMRCSKTGTINECQLACAQYFGTKAFLSSGYSEEEKAKQRCCDSVGGYFDRQCVKMQHFDLFPLGHEFLTKDVYREPGSSMAKIGAVDVFFLQGVPYTGTITSYHNYILGTKSRETTYVNGIINGIEKYWYPTDQLQQTITWKNGYKDGQSKEWFENGQQQSQYDYVLGTKTYKHSESDYSHPESKCCASQQYWNPDGTTRPLTLDEMQNDLDLKAQIEQNAVLLKYRKQYKRSSVFKYCSQSDIQMTSIDIVWDLLEEYYIISQTKVAQERKWTSVYIDGVMHVLLGDYSKKDLDTILEKKELPTTTIRSRRSQRKLFTKERCLAYFNFVNKVDMERLLKGDSTASFKWTVK